MPQAFVNYIASAMPSATVDKWDVAYNFIRDGKLTAGDFIGIGIQVTASRHHYLFCVTNRFVRRRMLAMKTTRATSWAVAKNVS